MRDECKQYFKVNFVTTECHIKIFSDSITDNITELTMLQKITAYAKFQFRCNFFFLSKHTDFLNPINPHSVRNS